MRPVSTVEGDDILASLLAGGVLVTGGLGFVGSALVERLCDADLAVTVLDDESRGLPENVDQACVELVRADIRHLDGLLRFMDGRGFSTVIHLAATHFLSECDRDPPAAILNNVVGTENVLAACAAAGVERVVAASSMAVYPIGEQAFREEDPVGPYDVYGETKVANELQLGRWSRGGKQRVGVTVRLSNAYGPRETNPHVIPEIMDQLALGKRELDLGSTAPFRDYIHVDDVAAALHALISAPLEAGYHVFNLGSGTERSVDQVVAELSRLLGITLTIRADPARVRTTERMHLLPDISKIMESVPWAPGVEFTDGLRDLCRTYGLLA